MCQQSTRRFPPPWAVEQIPGGYKVKDANGQSLAYVYGRETKADADIANVLTMDEARRIASNIAKLPTFLVASPDVVKLRGQDLRVKHSLTILDDALSSLKPNRSLAPVPRFRGLFSCRFIPRVAPGIQP